MKTSKDLKMNNVGAGPVSARKEKGITLVALIITIIVMLILVGVSVQVVINSDLIGTAQSTGDDYKTAYEKEKNLGNVAIEDTEYNSIDEYIVQQQCSHNWLDWNIEKQANCTEVGEKTRKCTICGKQEREVIPVIHNYEERVCTICGKVDLHLLDYVNYTPSGTPYSTSYPVAKKYSGYTSEQTVYLQDTKWRILNINADGTVELISEKELYIGNSKGNTTRLYFKGATGYNNCVEILNDLCNTLYLGDYATEARSINIVDIQEHMDTSVWNWKNYVSNDGTKFGVTREYNGNKCYPARWLEEIKSNVDSTSTGGILEQSDTGDFIEWNDGELEGKTYYEADNNIIMTKTIWAKTSWDGNNFIKPEYYNLFITHEDNTNYLYWLATRSADPAFEEYGTFGLYRMSYGGVMPYAFYYSTGENFESKAGIRVIVTLEDNLTFTKDDNSSDTTVTWNIS